MFGLHVWVACLGCTFWVACLGCMFGLEGRERCGGGRRKKASGGRRETSDARTKHQHLPSTVDADYHPSGFFLADSSENSTLSEESVC
jgi:hypothetical protein